MKARTRWLSYMSGSDIDWSATIELIVVDGGDHLQQGDTIEFFFEDNKIRVDVWKEDDSDIIGQFTIELEEIARRATWEAQHETRNKC